MIKAIIFDCFGVLVESSFEPFKKKYLEHDQNLVTEAELLDQQSSRGVISHEKLLCEFAKLAQISVEQTTKEIDFNPRNPSLLEYINDALKPKYKIGFLSNASDNWLNELFTEEDIALFDDIVLSYEHNLAKPDTALYKIAAERLDVKPSECIFIDDRVDYIKGARDIGMSSVQYTDFESFKKQIEELL
jgi:putative hydrolase of the HAD superfamily